MFHIYKRTEIKLLNIFGDCDSIKCQDFYCSTEDEEEAKMIVAEYNNIEELFESSVKNRLFYIEN